MFRVGSYNVELWNMRNYDEQGHGWCLLDLAKFDSKDRLLKQNYLYVDGDKRYEVLDDLEHKQLLDQLIRFPKNSKISIESHLVTSVRRAN